MSLGRVGRWCHGCAPRRGSAAAVPGKGDEVALVVLVAPLLHVAVLGGVARGLPFEELERGALRQREAHDLREEEEEEEGAGGWGVRGKRE